MKSKIVNLHMSAGKKYKIKLNLYDKLYIAPV